jgi:glycosyltransferase involved in cell wall biosynthesis
MSNCKLSVITPTYNSVKFIEKCILNVISQQCQFVEHIIVDGGSTDGTVEIIEEYAKKHPHIKWVSDPDNGQSDAMNKGVAMAESSVIGFLNADDAYFPHVLNRVNFLFNSNPKLSFATGNCKVVDEEGALLYINRPKRIKDYHLFSFEEPFPINPVAYFYKKEIHDDVGFYNVENHFNMDYEFLLRAVQKFTLVYFEEDWGVMLHHEMAKTAGDSLSNELWVRKRKTYENIYNQIPTLLKIKSLIYKGYKRIKR